MIELPFEVVGQSNGVLDGVQIPHRETGWRNVTYGKNAASGHAPSWNAACSHYFDQFYCHSLDSKFALAVDKSNYIIRPKGYEIRAVGSPSNFYGTLMYRDTAKRASGRDCR